MWVPRYLRALSETLRTGLNEIKEVLKEQKSSIDAATETATNQKGDIPRAIVSLRPTDDERKVAHAENEKNRTVQRLIAAGTWVAACAAVAAAIGAFIYAHISAKQAAIMSDTLTEIKNQTPSIKESADAAQKSAAASASQADIAKAQSAESIREFRLAQRPWVIVKTVDLGIVPTNGIPILKVLTIITNSGKSPAFDIKISHSGVQTNYGSLDIDKWVRERKEPIWNKVITSPVLAPDDTNPITTADIPLTEQQAAEIRSKTLWVYDFGEIQYLDSFNVQHKTLYCALYNPPTSRFDICSQHVYVDRAQ